MRTLILLAALLLTACAINPLPEESIEDIPLKAVDYVDLDRYMGRWYIMANIPYFAERGNVEVYVEYSRTDQPNVLRDLYHARDGFGLPQFVKKGTIVVENPTNNAEGKITFLEPLWQDYAVLYVDPEYQFTLIGHPTRNFCWLFARTPQLSEEMFQKMLGILAENHYDVSRVLRIPQRPEESGQPGFQ